MIPLNESPFVMDSEFWIILSNFGLIAVTVVSIREEHRTIRAVTRANNKLIRKILDLLLPGTAVKNAKHSKGSD